jgi:hypothetical protein
LPGLDPAADEILSELTEAAARVVEFLGLRMASREESFTNPAARAGSVVLSLPMAAATSSSSFTNEKQSRS